MPDLNGFALELGFVQKRITQAHTNFPHSIETAGWQLACEWWDKTEEPISDKKSTIINALHAIEKQHLVDELNLDER